MKQRPLANCKVINKGVVLSQVYGKTVTHQYKTNIGGQRQPQINNITKDYKEITRKSFQGEVKGIEVGMRGSRGTS